MKSLYLDRDRFGLTAADHRAMGVMPEIPTKENHMFVTRVSILSGKQNTMDLPLTKGLVREMLINPNIDPHAFVGRLTDEQFAFVMTGATPDEWAQYIGPEPKE